MLNAVYAKLKKIDLGYEAILEQVALAQKSYVKIGFQEGSVTKTQKKGSRTQKPNLSMPQIAARNEYGYKNIPARPFMSTALSMNATQINDYLSLQMSLIITGKTTTNKALGLIGQLVQALIQKRIRQIVYPPNSPYTIAIKKSSKPLIDFGQMVQSVRYVIGQNP